LFPGFCLLGGIAGGAAADGIITGSDILAKGKENAQSSGYIAMGEQIKDAIDGKSKITVDQAFGMAMLPVADGVGGFVSGNVGKSIALKPEKVIKEPGIKPGMRAATIDSTRNEAAIGKVSKTGKVFLPFSL